MLEFMRYLTVLASAILLPVLAFGQTPAVLSFEVATIKPAEAISPAMIVAGKLHIGMNVDGSRVDIGSMSLADLIPIAYKVKPYQISGPDWMGTQRFDILAKLPEGATKEQVPEMMQALLAERFKLKIHRETRDQSVYALVVGKGPLKLKEAAPDPETPPEAAKGAIVMGTGNNQVQINANNGGATVTSAQGGTTKMAMSPTGQMRMEMSKVTMPAFVDMLSRLVDRPVVDMTELKGNYQLALDLSMSDLLNVARASGMAVPGLGAIPGLPAGASDPSGGSIFASVQELGLKLDSRKAPLEFLVIDHMEKEPTDN
jgi:uncharacterized protein (TIGR03435 family)